MGTEAIPYLKNLADSIFRVMHERNWSIIMTAGFCGISERELGRILKRENDIQISTVARISEGLDIPVEMLLTKREPLKVSQELIAQINTIVKAAGEIRKGVKE